MRMNKCRSSSINRVGKYVPYSGWRNMFEYYVGRDFKEDVAMFLLVYGFLNSCYGRMWRVVRYLRDEEYEKGDIVVRPLHVQVLEHSLN